MLSNHRPMNRWRVVVVVLGLAACTKPNPRSCADGTCTDPEFPFCDVTGELEGTPQTCIAVECAPGEFRGCRDDLAITCNAEGTDFDLVECGRGCEDDIGCRLCDPNETACTNGTVATCDANGVVTESEPCPLGCFESEPRCRELDPSNDLATFLDLTNLQDLVITDGDIRTDTGTVVSGGEVIAVTTFLLAAPQGGLPIRVIAANNVHISNTNIGGGGAASAPALAILARGEVIIDGRITATAAGSFGSVGVCAGGDGQNTQRTASDNTTSQQLVSGAGGGGNVTAGASGGAVSTFATAGTGGAPVGNAELIPLVGGCLGGGARGGLPGGALQISSRLSIKVMGIIDVRGQQGECDEDNGGGGAGGSVLLEAPSVFFGEVGGLIAKGGSGCTLASGPTPTPNDLDEPALGYACLVASTECTNGGNGGSSDVPPTGGASVTYSTSPTKRLFTAGGGGGSVGRGRINTATGEFTTSSGAVDAAVITTGTVNTR